MIRLSLQIQILIGLVLGIFTGLFLGEMVGFLDMVGNAFIMLLKMTILPFMSGSLIHAIGSLSLSGAKKLLKEGTLYFLLFWLVVLATIFVLPFSFPHLDTPLYHAGSSEMAGQNTDFLAIFIPRNPFHALANDIVPAVVLFSLFFGVALMQVKNKEPLLEMVDTINKTLIRITEWVSRLSPIGVFALVAASMGTMPFQHLSKIQVYLNAYLLGACFLTFWMLPTLVTALCPVGYGEFIRAMRPAILMAFTTGNNLVALPYLVTCLEEMAKKHGLDDKSSHSTIGSLVPITYNFPTAGNLLGILFIFFLGFFYGRDFSFLAYLKITAISLPVLFGAAAAVINAISFLIDQMRLPVDGLSLFLETLPITRNFQALSATMGMGAVAVLVTFACHQKTRIRPLRLAKKVAKSALILGVLVMGARLLSPNVSADKEVFSSLSLPEKVEARVYSPEDPPLPALPADEDSLKRIQRTKIMRVGYTRYNIPFSYLNERGELVGYDIAFTHHLAKELGATIEFIPFEFSSLVQDLENNRFDIAVGSVSVTAARLRRILFSKAYITQERVLVTKDYRRYEFDDLNELKTLPRLTIATFLDSALQPVAEAAFPEAKILGIHEPDDFLRLPPADALLWTKAEATTWCLIHPQYTAVVPTPSLGNEHYAYAMRANSPELHRYVDYLLGLMETDGQTTAQYDYWILGKPLQQTPRWSIIRDVLHWVPAQAE